MARASQNEAAGHTTAEKERGTKRLGFPRRLRREEPRRGTLPVPQGRRQPFAEAAGKPRAAPAQPRPAAAAPAALTLPTPCTTRDLAALPDRCGHPPQGAARRRRARRLPPSLPSSARLSPAQPRGRPRKHPSAAAGCSEAPAAKRARHRALRGLPSVPPPPPFPPSRRWARRAGARAAGTHHGCRYTPRHRVTRPPQAHVRKVTASACAPVPPPRGGTRSPAPAPAPFNSAGYFLAPGPRPVSGGGWHSGGRREARGAAPASSRDRLPARK